MELYKSLYDNTIDIKTECSPTQKEYILNMIPKIDIKGHEIIYFLIRMYHITTHKEITFHSPYSSVISTDSVEFNLNQLPIQLQHMILSFVRMHYEYISCEHLRS